MKADERTPTRHHASTNVMVKQRLPATARTLGLGCMMNAFVVSSVPRIGPRLGRNTQHGLCHLCSLAPAGWTALAGTRALAAVGLGFGFGLASALASRSRAGFARTLS